MEIEFNDIDRRNAWNKIFQEIRNESNNFSHIINDAKKIENKNLNRYRDVNPFDHSRVRIRRNDIDYINASLVSVDSASRNYILTQGPLPSTTGHFWLMIWEQQSSGILMLNRIIEKNAVKCHQYWPVGKENGGSDTLVMNDVNLKVSLLEEEKCHDFTTRKFLLEDLETSSSREILQFHYTTWPDFGVPESPAAFLNFLFVVRQSGVLSSNVGPAVVHCSAGIGRSGTFCLVDSCLVLVEKTGDPNCINVRQQLLEMRHYRMGLIQTPDQLRFSYLAIIEGVRRVASKTNPLDNVSTNNENLLQGCKQELSSTEINGSLPNASLLGGITTNDLKNNIPYEKLNEVDEDLVNKTNILKENNIHSSPEQKTDVTSPSELRRRARKEREEKTASLVWSIKNKQKESELWEKRKSFLKISFGLVFIIGLGYCAYKFYCKS